MPFDRFATRRWPLLPFLLAAATWLAAPSVLAQGLGAVPGLTPGLAPGGVFQSPQTRAELVAHAPDGVRAGQPVWVGLRLDHAPEWHTYWKNAGDSGLPTELRWTLPEGVTAGDIAWPTPRKFPIGNLANYGYDGTVVLPVPLQVGPDFRGSEVAVKLQASWLVCRKECIPEEAAFALNLPVNGSTAGHTALFDAMRDAQPRDLPAGGSRVEPETGHVRVALDGLPADWRGRDLELFPELTGIVEPGAPWTQAWEGDRWTARVPLSAHRFESPPQMVLVVSPANPPGLGAGLPGARIEAPVQGTWPAVTALPAPAAVPDTLQAALDANAARNAQASGATALTLGAALLGALIGGLILNLMPCVFPVLAIKVMAFARHADDRRAHRVSGLAYTAGVVVSFLLLGALLLGLRAAGEQLGWGFQLQSPAVVAALAVLFTLIGLNLAGLFEFGQMVPGRLATLQARHPVADSFLTGVLATAVASPCTAPFMGASLGLAIGLPAPQALAIFAVLGLGMALPYLLASWVPAVARALPRPGAWMLRFKQFMAFPMFATVVWLLWVLGQQSGIDGAAALLMLLVTLALAVWAWGLSGKGRVVMGGLSLVALAALAVAVGPNIVKLQDGSSPATPVATGVQGVAWERWSPQRQAELVAQGRAVFVDFTAAWCVTCQYNKRTTLADESVLADVAARQVALLRADWTQRDPAVTQALAALGRNGVPVYAIYKNGQPVKVLSEVLSVEEVRSALASL
ncbi:MAG: thioredoxin family protein [Hydrogenophaga sp.]|nr:thioredoxin family protein [Hydrogenophaga sp.]